MVVFLFPVLMLVMALVLSGLSGYISVLGLTQIFPGEYLIILLVGAALEASKLILAGVIHLYWKRLALWMKVLFSTQVVVLMIITAMGVFGFLSRSHIDTMSNTSGARTEIAKLQVQIDSENDKLASLKQKRSDLDKTIDEASKGGFVSAAVKARAKAQPQYDKLDDEERLSRIRIEEIKSVMAEKDAEMAKVRAEVGPLIYIAQLIWGAEDDDTIAKAVRTLILMLMFVFDPLAVGLVVASMIVIALNYDKRVKRKEKEKMRVQTKKIETGPKRILTPTPPVAKPQAAPAPVAPAPRRATKSKVADRVAIASTTDGSTFTRDTAAVSLKKPVLAK